MENIWGDGFSKPQYLSRHVFFARIMFLPTRSSLLAEIFLISGRHSWCNQNYEGQPGFEEFSDSPWTI